MPRVEYSRESSLEPGTILWSFNHILRVLFNFMFMPRLDIVDLDP